jgi:hypothetical protein
LVERHALTALSVEEVSVDEGSAKRQGLEVVRREMAFTKGFVACTNCGACYDQNDEPRFCQAYSFTVDPSATEVNIFKAEACEQWVPKGLDRTKVILPDHKYWYDDFDPTERATGSGSAES